MPSSSLISDDPSVLLTTAGMQQFKPYFVGKADPIKDFGTLNTASIQKSFRTSDIEEVGDESHLTFFEMLGNFSFGGYFKEGAIKYAYDFLKSLGLEIEFVTIFGGDKDVLADEESAEIWQNLGIKRIEKRGREDNFWGPTGKEGPCGPTTEIYIDGIEIWNLVFNQYYCDPSNNLIPLKQNGVDTGMGLERLVMVIQRKKNIFETDLFASILYNLPEHAPLRIKRIVADHLRGSAFLLADGVRPSNKEAGYILRRLIRRILVYAHTNGFSVNVLKEALDDIFKNYGDFYPELLKERFVIYEEFMSERDKFLKTLERGIKELRKLSEKKLLDAKAAFHLYETYGLPYEIIKELGREAAQNLTQEGFEEEFEKHREVSRAGKEKKFGGHGLILDTGELKARDEEELKKVTRLHTATHLLQAALRKVLGETVRQAGSDITAERTRFDFTFGRRLNPEEIKKIEDLVNYAVDQKYEVRMVEMPYEEAIKTGALYFEKEKYPPVVKVYSVGNFIADPPQIFSSELCGGPHVKNTSEIGRFKILKEESVSAGVRRIRATVED